MTGGDASIQVLMEPKITRLGVQVQRPAANHPWFLRAVDAGQPPCDPITARSLCRQGIALIC